MRRSDLEPTLPVSVRLVNSHNEADTSCPELLRAFLVRHGHDDLSYISYQGSSSSRWIQLRRTSIVGELASLVLSNSFGGVGFRNPGIFQRQMAAWLARTHRRRSR
jgi:hypothetical protein